MGLKPRNLNPHHDLICSAGRVVRFDAIPRSVGFFTSLSDTLASNRPDELITESLDWSEILGIFSPSIEDKRQNRPLEKPRVHCCRSALSVAPAFQLFQMLSVRKPGKIVIFSKHCAPDQRTASDKGFGAAVALVPGDSLRAHTSR